MGRLAHGLLMAYGPELLLATVWTVNILHSMHFLNFFGKWVHEKDTSPLPSGVFTLETKFADMSVIKQPNHKKKFLTLESIVQVRYIPTKRNLRLVFVCCSLHQLSLYPSINLHNNNSKNFGLQNEKQKFHTEIGKAGSEQARQLTLSS